MTQFASIDHRDLPWRAGQKVKTISTEDAYYTIVMRPNFQHNPPNPILTEFRRREYVRNIYARRQWLSFLRSGWDGSICKATPAQQAHARRVFERWNEAARHAAIEDLLDQDWGGD